MDLIKFLYLIVIAGESKMDFILVDPKGQALI